MVADSILLLLLLLLRGPGPWMVCEGQMITRRFGPPSSLQPIGSPEPVLKHA
uniref:Uncharacterized protein n=1 Tax=Setaria viridis TaxID=4556 RepID=A0A4V6D0S7_SETVI|nr:hypothetical protein SEVIR_9G135250v2 [Setaria viridis]